MYLIFLDTETTGLNPQKHRTIEIAYKVIRAPLGETVISYQSLIIQSPDVWAEADPESLQINGLTREQTLAGKTEMSIAADISEDLNHLAISEKNCFFVCQNPSFDRAFFQQILSADLQRSYGWPYHWLDLASMYWTFRLLIKKDPVSNIFQDGLSKNSIATYFHLPTEKAPHRAQNGVNHLIACYEEIFKSFRLD